MKANNPSILIFAVISFILFLVLGGWIWSKSPSNELPTYALAASNRLAVGLLAIVTTTSAFVLTLTSQLYTPKLIKIFVQSPIVFFSYNSIIFANLAIVLANLIQPGHPWYQFCVELGFVLSCFILAGTIPLLYQLTNYLRPDYFLPLIESLIQGGIQKLEAGQTDRKNYLQLIENWDVISNIALTAIKRDDRQLIRLAVKMLDKSLFNLLKHHQPSINSQWREKRAFFVPGLTKEGCSYLKLKKCWPEAYLMYKKSMILSSTTSEQNEVVSFACKNLHTSFQIAVEKKMDDILELHLMLMNSLMRHSLSLKSIQLFQSLSYHYRINIEHLSNAPYHLNESFSSWIYYGKVAFSQGVDFALETLMYDMGRLYIHLNRKNLDSSKVSTIYQDYIKDIWQEGIKSEGKISIVTQRAIVKTYWESILLNMPEPADILKLDFLTEINIHYAVFNDLKSFNSPLGWELKDRLLSFTYLSPEIIRLAEAYFKSHLNHPPKPDCQ